MKRLAVNEKVYDEKKQNFKDEKELIKVKYRLKGTTRKRA